MNITEIINIVMFYCSSNYNFIISNNIINIECTINDLNFKNKSYDMQYESDFKDRLINHVPEECDGICLNGEFIFRK